MINIMQYKANEAYKRKMSRNYTLKKPKHLVESKRTRPGPKPGRKLILKKRRIQTMYPGKLGTIACCKSLPGSKHPGNTSSTPPRIPFCFSGTLTHRPGNFPRFWEKLQEVECLLVSF